MDDRAWPPPRVPTPAIRLARLRDLALVPAAGVTALAILVFSADTAAWVAGAPDPDAPVLAFCPVAADRDPAHRLLAALTLGPVLGLLGLACGGRPRSWFAAALSVTLAGFWLYRFFLRIPGCPA